MRASTIRSSTSVKPPARLEGRHSRTANRRWTLTCFFTVFHEEHPSEDPIVPFVSSWASCGNVVTGFV